MNILGLPVLPMTGELTTLVGIFYGYYLNGPSLTPEDELLTKVVIPVK